MKFTYILVVYDLLTCGEMTRDIIFAHDDLDKIMSVYYAQIDKQKAKGYGLEIYKIR